MKFKFLKSKSLYVTIGSVSLISSFGYLSHRLVTKYNFFAKNDIKSVSLDENKDYIYLTEELSNDYSEDFGSSQSSSTHLQLLGLIESTSGDNQVSEAAFSAITSTLFNDFQYREIAQNCHFKTGLRLARTPGVSSKLFLPPLKTHFLRTTTSPEPVYDFNQFLLNMFKKAHKSGDHCSECTKLFTELSIEMLERGRHSRQLDESIDFNDIHNFFKSLLSHKTPEVDWLYLQAIGQNILYDKTQCQTLVDSGLFLVLHYLRNNFSDEKVHDWVAQTLANLSVHKEFHSHFWSTNWFAVLVDWLQSDRLEWSLSAAKILHNLSEDSSDHLFPESIYLLHPLYYDTSNKNFDIVMVHGLLGGTFKTWRQCDTEKDTNAYTRCWPQTWLAAEVPNLRLLSVNYQTFVSNWNIECQDNTSVFTLKQRSSQLLKDLLSSRVGEKPIIWITHSMGGLIVKQMLVDINESNDPKLKPILNQTKGIVFYSVPHKGSDIAVWTPYLQRIISPSSELLELRKGSKSLLSLHERFVKMIETQGIACLSFGETLKSIIYCISNVCAIQVPKDSANPDIGHFHLLDENHFNSCKPKHKTSDSYRMVLHFIKSIVNRNKGDGDGSDDKISVLLSSTFT
ncbi:unnamed protein product [Oppiella nova]|uniref:Protein SERAC1 n=1 Tax=Oppiella nova TaxID=334625 RepID=A0A7R9LFM9_9ACAR|nr:unnamed protein product [Oppiella nova]CAG2163171.1 unnamed protein product [Oppiella nova]